MLPDHPFAPETVAEQLVDQRSPLRVTSRFSRKMRRSALLVVLIGVVSGGFIFLPSLYVSFFSAALAAYLAVFPILARAPLQVVLL